MTQELTLKERVLNTFAKKKIDKIVFSPRIYFWYIGNKLFQKRRSKNNFPPNIPSHFVNKSQLEIYEYIGASPRYADETLYIYLLESKYSPDSKINVKTERGSKKDETITIFETPMGNLTQVSAIGAGLSGHTTDYPIKSIEDLKIMKYILENTEINFSQKNYEKAEKEFGNMGIVSTYMPRSPYQKLITQFMGFSRTILFFKRYLSQMEDFLKFMETCEDKLYDIIAKTPLKIINFGENIDANLSSPPYFEKYLIPYYERKVKQIHRKDKYCHIHIDGSVKKLLPYLADLPFDGIEALTPEPQGDVTLEELHEAIGNKIMLDGVPSILFLPEYSNEYVSKYAQKVLEMFAPNLILGVSDELSPNGDIRKVEMIARVVEKFEP